jgi:hypothetical protein
VCHLQDGASNLLGSEANGHIPRWILDVLGQVQEEVRRAKTINRTEQTQHCANNRRVIPSQVLKIEPDDTIKPLVTILRQGMVLLLLVGSLDWCEANEESDGNEESTC